MLCLTSAGRLFRTDSEGRTSASTATPARLGFEFFFDFIDLFAASLVPRLAWVMLGVRPTKENASLAFWRRPRANDWSDVARPEFRPPPTVSVRVVAVKGSSHH